MQRSRLMSSPSQRKDDPTAPATISMDVGKAMQKARQDQKLSQKDLAAKVNEKVCIIRLSGSVR